MVQTETESHLLTCLRQLLSSEEGRACLATSHGELFLLWYVRQHNGLVLPSELSEAMSVSTARIARLLNTLESRCLIIREMDQTDRRRVFVTLTEEGNRRVEAVYQRVHRRITAIINELGEEDTETFVRIAERIVSISIALNSKETGG